MCIVVQFVSGSGRSFCKILYTNPTQAGTIIITMATLLLSIYKGNFVVRSPYCNTDFRDTQSCPQRLGCDAVLCRLQDEFAAGDRRLSSYLPP